jgi:hypothetical protein
MDECCEGFSRGEGEEDETSIEKAVNISAASTKDFDI